VSCSVFGTYLCRACGEKILPVSYLICPVCERAAIGGFTHPGCKTRYSLDGLISLYTYEGPIRAALKRLKYKPYLADLAEVLVRLGKSELGRSFANFAVVPVPLHPQRQRERGFNQATLIGRAVARQLSLIVTDRVIKRTRYTKPQVNLSGKERRVNLINAFTLGTNQLQNPRILLVDDVWTTGSTLRACANVLKRAGAKDVWAFTIAR